MSVHPLISVVMPVHNAGEYLLPAVQSILAQTFTDFELIIINDHSTDHAFAALPTDPRIKQVDCHGRGVIDAANTGIAHARGDFLARMDADDISLPQRFAQQLEFFKQHPSLGIVGSQVKIFSSDGSVGEGMRVYESWLNDLCSQDQIEKQLFIESPIPHPSMMVRKEVFDQLKGYQDKGWPEDYDLLFRCWQKGIGMAKVRNVLLHWREHPGRYTYQHGRYSARNFMRARVHYLPASLFTEKSIVIMGSGPNGRQLYDLLLEQQVEADGFIDVNPRKHGNMVRGIPVWSVEDISRLTNSFFLVAIGLRGVREDIRQLMFHYGRQEAKDYLFML